MARLPVPGQDTGTWGSILNDYLAQAHNTDGTLKSASVTTTTIADGSITEAKLDNATQVKLNTVGSGGATDLTTSSSTTTVTVASSTGQDAVIPSASSGSAGILTAADKSKLDGVAVGATANSTDAALVSRANHTGTQPESTVTNLVSDLAAKQATLVSGTNIKTINGATLLGSGDISISGSTSDATTSAKGIVQLAGDLGGTAASPTVPGLANKQATLVSGTNIKTINGTTLLGSGDITVSGSTSDATSVAKGIVQLAGDLGGTAALPTVPALASKEPTLNPGTTAQYYRGDKTWQTLNQDVVPDGTTNKAYTATEKTKLAGVAGGATANSSDATLLNRANHTGSQAISTVTGLQTAIDAKADKTTTVSAGTGLSGGGDLSANRTLSVSYGATAGTAAQGNDSRITGAEQTANKGAANGYAGLGGTALVPVAQLGTGTASTTTYLRGDGSWSAPTLTGAATATNGGGEVFFDAGNAGAGVTLDLANGNVQRITLTQNTTITLANPAAGAYRSLMIYVTQDGTGGWTVTWPVSVKWGSAGAPVLTALPAKMDKILLDTVDGGTTWYGTAGPGGY